MTCAGSLPPCWSWCTVHRRRAAGHLVFLEAPPGRKLVALDAATGRTVGQLAMDYDLGRVAARSDGAFDVETERFRYVVRVD